ncbi:hypothetical protein D3C75_1200900 [compost metagenome]
MISVCNNVVLACNNDNAVKLLRCPFGNANPVSFANPRIHTFDIPWYTNDMSDFGDIAS